MLRSQRGAIVELLLYAGFALGALAAIWGVVAWLEGKGYDKAEAVYKPKLEAEHKRAVDTQAAYDRFSESVAATAKAAQEAQAAREQQWRALLASSAEKRKAYEDQIARLDRDKLDIFRSMQHYRDIAAARARSGGNGVQAVPGPTGETGCRSTDDVAALRGTIEQLAAEARRTTVMFLDCRDSWKSLQGK